ncbi:MAG: AAA family ATPase [Anaerolineae bacterium]
MSEQSTQLPGGEGQAHLPQSIQSTRSKIFLAGPPGSGKTTLAVERLRWLIQRGMPTTSILVLTPQRTLATLYYDALRDPDLGPAGTVDVITLDGLARRVIQLFWPLIGDRAGFAHPTHPPVFLTVETAQYFMDGVVGPLINQNGYFDAVTIGRTRLLSQLLAARFTTRPGNVWDAFAAIAWITTCSTSHSNSRPSYGISGLNLQYAPICSSATGTSSWITWRRTRRWSTTCWLNGCPSVIRPSSLSTGAAAIVSSWAPTRPARPGWQPPAMKK